MKTDSIFKKTYKLFFLILCFSKVVFGDIQKESIENQSFLAQINNCIENGKFTGSVKIRNEFDHNDGKPKDADAFTLYSRVKYEMKCGDAIVVVEGQGNLGLTDTYNTTVNNKNQFTSIPDPNGANLHQAYLDYKFAQGINLKAGRQEFTWDDGSGINSATWRNFVSSYDAFRAILNPEFMVKNLSIDAAYLKNRIDNRNYEIEMKSFIGRVGYSGISNHNFSAHAFLINYDPSFLNLDKTSTATWGVFYSGHLNIPDKILKNSSVDFQANYDRQMDYARNPNQYSVNRVHVLATLNIKNISFYLGDHLLTSSHGKIAFDQNFAAKHAFLGYADQFLTTPNGGINDVELGILIKNLIKDGDNLRIAAHDFTSNVTTGNNSNHIGREIDGNYTFPADELFGVKGATLQIQAAYYAGDKKSNVKSNNDYMITGQANIPYDPEAFLKKLFDGQ